MKQEIRKIREDGDGYIIVKPSEYELDGFNRFGKKIDSTRNLANFLEWNEKNGKRLRIIGSFKIAQRLKEHYRQREQIKKTYLERQLRE